MTVRDEVMAHLIDFMVQTTSCQLHARAQEVFQNLPSMVLAEAWTAAELQATETWWQSIERTIDAEVIARAIGKSER